MDDLGAKGSPTKTSKVSRSKVATGTDLQHVNSMGSGCQQSTGSVSGFQNNFVQTFQNLTSTSPRNNDPLGLANRKTPPTASFSHRNIWAKKALERAQNSNKATSTLPKSQELDQEKSSPSTSSESNNYNVPGSWVSAVSYNPSIAQPQYPGMGISDTQQPVTNESLDIPLDTTNQLNRSIPDQQSTVHSGPGRSAYASIPGNVICDSVAEPMPKKSPGAESRNKYVSFFPTTTSAETSKVDKMQVKSTNYTRSESVENRTQEADPGISLMEQDSMGSFVGLETPREWIDLEYQRLLENISDEAILVEEDSFRDLSKLVRDFRESAITYGKVIISELCLPPERKQIRPADLPGFAGGQKFYAGDIFFRVSLDSNGLYGSDELAAKEAAHQLKGLTAMSNAGVDGLCLPLLALLDFRGFRVVATSILPIDGENTLCYGSSNGGRVIATGSRLVHGEKVPVGGDQEPSASELISKAAETLGLSDHLVQARDVGEVVSICMPTDIEVHQSQTSRDLMGSRRLYVLDFARLFPSQPPWWSFERPVSPVVGACEEGDGEAKPSWPGLKESVNGGEGGAKDTEKYTTNLWQANVKREREENANAGSGEVSHPRYSRMVKKMSGSGKEYEDRAPHLVYLLRPELVKQNTERLSSDAFSRFGLLNADQHNEQVSRAFQRLLQTVIPDLADELQEKLEPFSHMRTAYEAVFGHVDDPSTKHEAALRRNQERSGETQYGRNVTSFIEAVQKDGLVISHSLHRRGVNMRFLGLVRQSISNSKWRSALLHDAVSRCAKATLRELMRKTMSSAGRISGGATTKVISTVTKRLNQIFGRNECCSCRLRNEVGTTWWCVLPRMLNERFKLEIEPPTENGGWKASRLHGKEGCECCSCWWRTQVHLSVVFARVHKDCGLVLSPPFMQELESSLAADVRALVHAESGKQQSETSEISTKMIEKADTLFSLVSPFEEYDVDNIECKIKLLPIMEYSQGTMLFIRARNKAALGLKEESTRLARNALERLDAGLALSPDDPKILCNKGFLLENLFDAPVAAFNTYRASVMANPNHARSWYYLALFIARYQKLIRSGLRPRTPEAAHVPRRTGRRSQAKQKKEPLRMKTSSSSGYLPKEKQHGADEGIRRVSSTPIGTYSTNSLSNHQGAELELDFLTESVLKRVAKEKGHPSQGRRSNFVTPHDLEEECYRRSLDANPKLVNCLKDYANFKKHVRKNLKAAEELFKKALEVRPGHIRALTGFGNLLNDMKGRENESLEIWKKCMEVAPDEPIPAIQCAKAHLRLVLISKGMEFPNPNNQQQPRTNGLVRSANVTDKATSSPLEKEEEERLIKSCIKGTLGSLGMIIRNYGEDQKRGRVKPKLFATTDLHTYIRLVRQITKNTLLIATTLTEVGGCKHNGHEVFEKLIVLSEMCDAHLSQQQKGGSVSQLRVLRAYANHLKEHIKENQNDQLVRKRLGELELKMKKTF